MNTTLKSCLQKLTLPGYSPAQKKELQQRVRALINHPMNLKNHPGYEEESLLLSDMFESVCNGMITGDPAGKLLTISSDSLLVDWKHFILVIYNFYQNNSEKCLFHSKKIQETHPVYPICRLLPDLLDGTLPDDSDDLPRDKKHFFDSLIDYPQHLIKSFLELEDPLNENLEDIFTGSALLLLKDISVYNRKLTMKYALWCLSAIRKAGFSPKAFLKGMKPIMGAAESGRMIALSTIKTQPEISLLYWMKYLLDRWHSEAVPEDEIKSIMGLCGVLGLSVCSERDNSEDYLRILMDHMNQIIQELRMVYKELETDYLENNNDIKSQLLFWSRFAPGEETVEEPGKEDIQMKGEQLELFG